MSPMPALDSFAAELYDAMGEAVSETDEATGFTTAKVCAAVGKMWQTIENLIRDTPVREGWTTVVDPDAAPADWLPWLGQLGGVRVPQGTPEAPARLAVKRMDGQRRGRPAAIIEAVQALLNSPYRCHLLERTNPSDPGDKAYHATMVVRQSDTPVGTEATITTAFLRALPAGIIGHAIFTDETLVQELAGTVNALSGTVNAL